MLLPYTVFRLDHGKSVVSGVAVQAPTESRKNVADLKRVTPGHSRSPQRAVVVIPLWRSVYVWATCAAVDPRVNIYIQSKVDPKVNVQSETITPYLP